MTFPRLAATALLLLAPTAWAQDQDLQKLLDNLPTIESKAPPPAETDKPVEEVSIDLPTYTKGVRDAILANWHPKEKLVVKHPSLAAQLLVKVNADGTIKDVVAVKLSDNKKFDKSAVDAVFSTTQVGVPPVSLAGTVESGVLVNFIAATKRPTE